MWRIVENSTMVQRCRQKRCTLLMVFITFLVVAIVISTASFGGTPANSSLRMVHFVFKHGEVTPAASYPNDPHKDHVWKEGWHALTNKGKMEMFKLGQLVRERYEKFIGDEYDPEGHLMESSYAANSQMSAQVFLAGLFPPKNWQIWNTDLQWQPIPINPIPSEQDNKIAFKAKCRAFDGEKGRVDRDLNTNLDKALQAALSEVSQRSGQKYSNVSQAVQLYYTLKTQKENNLDLPDWANEYFSDLAKMTAIDLASYSQSTLLKRLHTGPLLREWVANMRAADTSNLKAKFYSGTDLSLVPLMNTLGFDKLDLPQYGAALAMEYHQTHDSHDFIQVVYFKNAHPTPDHPGMETLMLPGCAGDCTLEEFAEKIQDFISWDDWTAECRNH